MTNNQILKNTFNFSFFYNWIKSQLLPLFFVVFLPFLIISALVLSFTKVVDIYTLFLLIPEISFFYFIICFLLTGVYNFKNEKSSLKNTNAFYNQINAFVLAIIIVIFFVILVYQNLSLITGSTLLPTFYLVSFYTTVIKVVILVSGIAILMLSKNNVFKQNRSLVEYPSIICFSLFFMLLLISSLNLFNAYLCLEGLTFSLYILAGMDLDSQNAMEASIKYFCLGSLASGFLLFGIALLYMFTQTMNFLEIRCFLETAFSSDQYPLLIIYAVIFLIMGFWFKLSVFPCHLWTPDVYEGVNSVITLYFATVVKLAVFAFFTKFIFFTLGDSKLFFLVIKPLFLFGAVGSIVAGALGALIQTKIKRFIGYTSINQMGFLMLGLSSGTFFGIQTAFGFLFIYIVMLFAFFSIFLCIKNFKNNWNLKFINELRFFGHKNKISAFFLIIVLFSMAGIPPLAGFFGKFFLFLAVFQTGELAIVVIALFTNIISTFYYLKLIKSMYFENNLEANKSFVVKKYYYFVENNFVKLLTFVCVTIIVILPFFFDNFLKFTHSLAWSCLGV